MFEGILESILNNFLGKYIQGLKSEDLKVSIWSGNLQLQNVKLKSDIFQQFKLPLALVCGQIGNLKVSVPWQSIGTKPVDVLIENVYIVVKPITDQTSWDHTNQNENFEIKEAALNAYAYQIYQELIKTKEEIAKDQGMMKGIISKVIDNLQVSISNVHIRVENEDLEDKQCTFSLGVTLKQMTFNTTDSQWKKQYIDRTQKENADLPLYKLLMIDNFAIYYKINEQKFLTNLQDQDQNYLFAEFKERFKFSKDNGKIIEYEKDYLLDPIQLKVHLKQYDAAQALTQVTSALNLNIELKSFAICLQKCQYDNLQRLLELTNDYMRFWNTSALKQKKIDLKEMNEVLISEGRCQDVVTKRQVKEIFTKIYQSQLELVIKHTLDEKKQKELQKALQTDLDKKQNQTAYRKIICAIEKTALEAWSQQVANNFAEKLKSERAQKEKEKIEKSKSSWFSWGSSSQTVQNSPVKDSSQSQHNLIPESALKNFENTVEENLQIEESMKNIYAQKMRSVPYISITFELEDLKLTLIHHDAVSGLQLYMKKFMIEIDLFESTNKYNNLTVKIKLDNQAFGLDVIADKQTIPFVKQLQQKDADKAVDLMLALGNTFHKQSDLPPEQIDMTDLDLKLKLLPIEIIYQAQPIEQLTKFFKVKNMRDHTKIAAREQFNGLSKQVNGISKQFEADLKNNKISIEIDAPCLVLPFKQQSQQEINLSECWVFTMGDACFKTIENDKDLTDSRYHEAFQLKVSKVKFELVNQYQEWKQMQANITPVLKDFQTTVSILRKRDLNEMRNQESRDALMKLKSPDVQVIASFDNDILLQIKPEVFLKLCRISELLISEAKPEQHYIDKMNKRLSVAHLTLNMQKQNIFKQWIKGTGCLLKPGKICFFEEHDIFSEFEFELDGVNLKDCCIIEGQEIYLENSKEEQVKLLLPSTYSAARWQSEIILAAEEINKIKQNIEINETLAAQSETDEDLDERSQIQQTNRYQEFDVDTDEQNQTPSTLLSKKQEDHIIFAFQFQAPSIQLQLLTETKNRFSKTEYQNWNLLTFVELLNVKFQQKEHESLVEVSIHSLKVTDNSGDERFESIFENQPCQIQKDLLTIKLKQISNLSPRYQNVDTELSICFGSLIVNWKPQCIIFLVKFLTAQSIDNIKQTKQNKIQTPRIESNRKATDLDEIKADDQSEQQENSEIISTDKTKDKKKYSGQKNCLQKPETMLKINLKLSQLKAVFIHPDNHTYPLFSVEIMNSEMIYVKKYDCDRITILIENLQLFDHSNYPLTLDPFIQYQKEDNLAINEILGVNSGKTGQKPKMLELELVIFTYPGENGCCPLQASKDYSMNLKVDLKQIRVVFICELTLRIVDYIIYQVANLISINIAEQVKQNTKSENSIQQTQVQQVQQVTNSNKKWEQFDLKQEKQIPCLQINVQSPVFIIQDLKSDDNYFLLDFGKICVSSQLLNQTGRWINFPNKLIYEQQIQLKNEKAKLDFVSKNKTDNVFEEDSMKIQINLVNPSSFILDDFQEELRKQENRPAIFDQSLLDLSVKVNIELNIFKIIFKQSTFTGFFDLLNNNLIYKDKYSDYFKQILVIQADSVDKKSLMPKFREQYQDKKMTQVRILAGCLSIEMRDNLNLMITEICIAGLDFTFEDYLSKRQVIHFNAGTLFMFHDEFEQVKQVMMGHLDAVSEVNTDQTFYLQIPGEFKRISEQQQDKFNFKLSIQKSPDEDMDMYLELKDVKLYLRQQVVLRLSQFLIEALERLDLSYAPSVENDVQISKKENNTSHQKIQIHIQDSLLILENSEVSRKCIVLQVTSDILLKQWDQRNLRLTLEPQQFKMFNQTKVDVKSLSAFFCNLDDISENGYNMADKRDVLQPLEFHLDYDQTLKNNSPDKMILQNEVSCQVAEVILKLSMDDLYIFNSIAMKQAEDFQTLIKAWKNYSNKTQVTRQVFEEKKILSEEDLNQDQIIESINFQLKRAEALVINEHDGCYVPMFYGSCSEMSLDSHSDSQIQTDHKSFQMQIGADYFHAKLGCYEPVVEQLPLKFTISKIQRCSDSSLEVLEPLNINLSVGLATCLSSFKKLWDQSQKNAEEFQKFEKEIKLGVRESLKKKEKDQFQKIFSSRQNKTLISHNYLTLTPEEQMQKIASPYAIRNLTDKPIEVFATDRDGKLLFSGPVEIINPEEMKKLVLNQNDQSKNITAARKQTSGQGTQMDLFVKLTFAEQSMRPVSRINLNRNNSMLLHNVYSVNQNLQNGQVREKYILQSNLEENRRVLTIRTLHILRNQTNVQYHIRIFYVDSNNKVIITKDTRLAPGQIIPLPDHQDEQIQQKIKIAIRPSQCRKWSQEFKLQAMKEKIIQEINIVWQHHETYSILRKVKTELDQVFDFVLQPPLIIKNCLPSQLVIDICGTQKPEKSKPELQADEDEATYVRQIILDKQDEKQVQDIKKQTGELTLSINLGSQFASTELKLLPDQAKECDIAVRIFDKRGRYLTIKARIETKKAGLHIIFYCENVLICRTIQPLNFFYHKRAGVFTTDFSNQFCTPIVDEEENVIYIFENCREVYAMLSENIDTGFSGKLPIDAGGSIGDFSVQKKDKKSQYNFAYSSHLWSVSESEFISTKIVEIVPQFIICNCTTYELLFQQEQVGHTFTKLDPGQRQPYHWDDPVKPTLLKFKPMIETIYFCPSFSLKDVGSIVVGCRARGLQLFFKVTKRIINQSIFCIIEDSGAPYQIRNRLSTINLEIRQAETNIQQIQSELINAGEEISFAWTDFGILDPMLSVEFMIGDDIQLIPMQPKQQPQQSLMPLLKQKSKLDLCLKYSLDDLNEFKIAKLAVDNQQVLQVYISIYKDKNYKVIEFSDTPSKNLTQVNEEFILLNDDPKKEESKESQLSLNTSEKKKTLNLEGKDNQTFSFRIPQISISCINENREVITICLHDILLKQVKTDTDIIFESYLMRLQIDNNNELEPLYPVLMKPKCTKGDQPHDHFDKQTVEPIFQFNIHTKTNVPNVRYIELVEFLVRELEVKIELDHIFNIIDWVLLIQEQLNTNLTAMSPVFKKRSTKTKGADTNKIQTHFDEELIKTWRSEEIKHDSETFVYIKNYKGSPMLIELSLFKQTGTQEQLDLQKIQQQKDNNNSRGSRIIERLGNFGIQITSINNAPIKLEALEITHIYGTEDSIQAQLLKYYIGNLKKNIFRVAASFDLLGNPYNFVNTLGRGVKTVYYEPKDGFMKGSLGLIKNTAGLVGVTGASVAGSIGKATNALNKGIVAISLDKNYIHDKEINDIQNKPKNTLDGMSQGFKGFGTSVVSGVTGVFSNPIKGAQTGGIGGFFKGAGMGIVGLVAKPVSGVVDLVSKTTQGIETQATGNQECKQSTLRMRDPRPFYRDLSIVKEYNTLHAQVFNLMRKSRITLSPFFGAFKCEVTQITDARTNSYITNSQTLILTQELLFALNQNLDIVFEVFTKDITGLDFIHEKGCQAGVIISFTNRKNRAKKEQQSFCFISEYEMRLCKDQLDEIKYNLRIMQDQ